MKIGDKVVCIDDSIPRPEVFRDFAYWPYEGSIYTIRGMQNSIDRGKGLQLEELPNPTIYVPELGGHVEPAYSIKRFRELSEPETLEAVNADALVCV